MPNQGARGQLVLMPFQYSLVFGLINFAIAIIATFLIDKIGRRLLLLTTFPFMSLLQLAIGFSFRAPEAHRHALVIAFTYLFCIVYSIGEGPVPLVGGWSHHCWCLEEMNANQPGLCIQMSSFRSEKQWYGQ